MLDDMITLIKPLDIEAMEKCQLRLDNLTKPLGSLHSFEHLARQIAGITRTPQPSGLRKSIILMASDEAAAAVAASQQTTVQRIADVCNGEAAINVFAEHVAAKIVLVDVGVAVDLPHLPQVRNEKIAYGTKNITQEAAMTRQQVIRAIRVGMQIAREETAKGSRVLGLGELSSSSAVSATAVIACYSSRSLEELTADPAVAAALAVNCPDRSDPLDVLRRVGSFDVAGLVGVILGAAACRAAVVLDGLATSAAALIAVKIAPAAREFLIGSHFAIEPAHREALALLELPAYLRLEMNLGEGTGAALGMSLITAALHVLNDMKTFSEAAVAVAQDGPGAVKQSRGLQDLN